MRFVKIRLSEIMKELKIQSDTEDLGLEILIDKSCKILYPPEVK